MIAGIALPFNTICCVKEGADVAASASGRCTSKAVISAAQPHHTAWQHLNNWAVQAGVSGPVW